MTAVLHSRTELAAARSRLAGRVGLVPTMGALHDGHTALLDRARDECDAVVVSVFVNPAQFGPAEDFNRYPRSLESDVARCRRAGVDTVWVPSVDEVYPEGVAGVTVSPGPLGSELEGVIRPTHFSGVLTVVVKLFNLFRPHVGYFGEKDYQQLTLIRQMSADLDLGVDVVGVPTVRERDGLALSSRNAYLSATDRRAALALSRALFAGRAAAGAGADAVVAEAKRVAGAEPGIDLDYLVLRNPDLGPAPEHGPARLLVAGRVGTTRLIDNVEVVL
jgi:pantoate--beta-alanine ligase